MLGGNNSPDKVVPRKLYADFSHGQLKRGDVAERPELRGDGELLRAYPSPVVRVKGNVPVTLAT